MIMCRIGSAQQRPESYPARDEVNRSHSVKSMAKNHRMFRASDLIVCEVLGRGFYGQAVKVSNYVKVISVVGLHVFKMILLTYKSLLTNNN